MKHLSFLLCIAALSGTIHAEGWGDLEGQIVLDGELPQVQPLLKLGAKDGIPNEDMMFDDQTKGIANVCIYLRQTPAIHPDLKAPKEPAVKFTIRGMRYRPHVLVVRTDQKISVVNEDNMSHLVHTNPFANRPNSGIAYSNDTFELHYARPESLPVKVTCDTHPWMLAWWLILDHPYAAVTGKQGTFRIEKLPAGEHSFRVWHPRTGYINRKLAVTIEADQTTKLEPIRVPVKKFRD